MTRPRDPAAGLTLIEVLVALAIVGVMTGVTVLSLDMLDRGGRAEAEAMRLARTRLQTEAGKTLSDRRLEQLIDEVIATNAAIPAPHPLS